MNKIVIAILMIVIAAIIIVLIIYFSPSMKFMVNQTINASNKSVEGAFS